MLGLLIAIPVSLVASVVYTVLAVETFERWPLIEKVGVSLSRVIAVMLLFEVALVVTIGPKSAYTEFQHAFTTLHFVVLLLFPPAFANLILRASTKAHYRKWLRNVVSMGCCWISCMAILIGQIMINESIVGIDAGRPFYMTSTKILIQPVWPLKAVLVDLNRSLKS